MEALSKDDLDKLIACLALLEHFYRVQTSGADFSSHIKVLHNLKVRARYRSRSAKDAPESPYSGQINEIYRCIYEDMSEEEAYSEVARIIQPELLDILNEKDEKNQDEDE